MDRKAFLHNLRRVQGRLGKKAGCLAVLKADAYGHGAAALARTLSGVWGIGVSSVEEGIALRRAGARGRILILGSLFPFDSFGAALDHNLIPTIASRLSAKALGRAAARRGLRAPCHVKVDTGMGRIGLSPATALEAIPAIAADPRLRVEGVYTHLADAESRARVAEQLSLFDTLIFGLREKGLSPLFHAANSAGIFLDPRTHYGLARPGLALYGVPPAKGVAGLRPVLNWKTRVVFLKTVPKGTPVSYGGDWRAPRRARLATLPVGYADGYRRATAGRAQVLVKGRRAPVVGRVTMDQIVVDVTAVPSVDVGEEVVLLGAQGRDRITAGEMAGWAGTIPYEILCGITSRVPRVVR